MSKEYEAIESEQRQHLNQLSYEAKKYDQFVLNKYALFDLLKLQHGIDGNQWYVLYGEDLHSGIAGFGDTLFDAICDFEKQFHIKVPQKANENVRKKG